MMRTTLFLISLAFFLAACQSPEYASSPQIPSPPKDPSFPTLPPGELKAAEGPDQGTVSEEERRSFFYEEIERNRQASASNAPFPCEAGEEVEEHYPEWECPPPYPFWHCHPYRHRVSTFPFHTLLYSGLGAIIGHQFDHPGSGAAWGALYGLMMDLSTAR